MFSRSVFSNLGPPDVLGLQLPEAFTTTSTGQDFWAMKSKNIWRPKVGDHCSRFMTSKAGSVRIQQEEALVISNI